MDKVNWTLAWLSLFWIKCRSWYWRLLQLVGRMPTQQIVTFPSDYDFSPHYGYTLQALLNVKPPEPSETFVAYWRHRYQRAMQCEPCPIVKPLDQKKGQYRVLDWEYQSTDKVTIHGWLLVPLYGEVKQALIIGHGYGGRHQPDWHWALPNTALFFPCFRGISHSRLATVSHQPARHVLHNIEHLDDYIIGGCVDDLWLAVSAVQSLYPKIACNIGYVGMSFGGGIGALALAWDERIKKAHLNMPTFGHQRLRLALPSRGSSESVRRYARRHPNVKHVLTYFDAATAASFIKQPIVVAAACFDPIVPPPGQFAVYNAIKDNKQLFVLEAGHFQYPNQRFQAKRLQKQVERFFTGMSG